MTTQEGNGSILAIIFDDNAVTDSIILSSDSRECSSRWKFLEGPILPKDGDPNRPRSGYRQPRHHSLIMACNAAQRLIQDMFGLPTRIWRVGVYTKGCPKTLHVFAGLAHFGRFRSVNHKGMALQTFLPEEISGLNMPARHHIAFSETLRWIKSPIQS